MDRIDLLASLTAGSTCVCDIGCDHGYTLISAIQNYHVKRGIGVDIRSLPLQTARENIRKAHLEDRITLVLSDGLSQVEEDFDTLVISGMGGILICDILNRGLWKLKNKRIIASANCDADLVRDFLYQKGFRLISERAIFDKQQYYEIMEFAEGVAHYDVYDVCYGPYLRRQRDPAFIRHYSFKKELLENILPNMNDERQKAQKMAELEVVKNLIEGQNMEKYWIQNTKNYYCTYFVDDTSRPTVMICPGGGYKYTSARESEPVAKALNRYGYHAVVIHYREELFAYPTPQDHVAAAIDEVSRDSRVKMLIGMGFSAGGHCLLETILHANDHHLQSRISLLILGYPVITDDERYRHCGSFDQLLSEKSSNLQLRRYLSLETQITKEAPDLFLWGTYTDESVSVMNSLLLLEAYRTAGANAEYHNFYFGGHGLSLADSTSSGGDLKKESPYIARWFDLAMEWLKSKLNH